MDTHPSLGIPHVDTSAAGTARQSAALAVRQNAAAAQARAPMPVHAANGDETALPNYIASYSRGLPHSSPLGEVDPAAYRALLAAIASGKRADFEQLPRGLGQKLANPVAANAYTQEGADSHAFAVTPAPSFRSSAMVADMVELYWQAQLRDINFADYATSPLVQRAAAELSQLPGYSGPRDAASLFRGPAPGDLAGPCVSQFLLKPYPVNSGMQSQAIRTGLPSADYQAVYSAWLLAQSGAAATETEVFDPQPRYLRNGRDLAQWVHYDYPQLAFQNAAFIVFDFRPETILNKNVYQLAVSNPYKTSNIQTGFATFGIVHVLSLIAYAATEALKAAWFQKWNVHRRLRPEAMAGRIHNRLTGAAAYPIDPYFATSDAVQFAFQRQDNYLLSQAYAEGAPLSPSYPAGHAVVAGAGATLMKAFFDETALVPNAVVPSPDGLSLTPYSDQALTIGGEANKLAFNIAMGRAWAGVNYRSDVTAGLLLGEEVAIGILNDAVNATTETFSGFSFTRFDGTRVMIRGEA